MGVKASEILLVRHITKLANLAPLSRRFLSATHAAFSASQVVSDVLSGCIKLVSMFPGYIKRMGRAPQGVGGYKIYPVLGDNSFH